MQKKGRVVKASNDSKMYAEAIDSKGMNRVRSWPLAVIFEI